ncbi:hypothetical protein ZIOFF_016469 [Zingiber officinale]|uniref:SPX domain-containing protein n=1 Tax=Zingiber officinale TaxID=94328 RepID=A0A8J5LVC3_ZINOF|nr:hypothetical protein ZIOFF_016469 [Zingiber officinale]
MVNFGKKLMANRVQEWEKYYINYKLMKKKVKQYVQQMEQGGKERCHVLKEFSRTLDDQVWISSGFLFILAYFGQDYFEFIEKTVLFFLEQQGIIAHRIQELGEERTLLLEQPVISKMSELREAYIEVGHDLLKLLRFVDMNATGIRKILKKFDKRFGYKFTDYYISTRSNHPYSQLQQVFKHVGIAAVVGALSHNLAEIQERQGSYPSLYDQPSTAMMVQDPVIYLIQESVDKLTHSTNFLKFLGQHALIHEGEEQVDERRYHFVSLLSNLVNTFLYMVNTYIIVPTADDYSMSLGAAATVCGIIIGSMAVAQVFSSVYFSAWSNKSYFRPLVFSSIVLFLGNTLYALAYDLNSLTILLIGRLLCGMGSARAVNRRYISDCVPNEIRMKASAGFVSASALGMACGPALAGLLQTNFKLYRLTINQDTLPGWVMAFAWLAYLIWLWISFKEPVRNTDDVVLWLAKLSNLVKQLPTVLVLQVQLLIYFMLKYSMEILLSESSVVSGYYFGWSTGQVAIFLAVLGLTVLPINAIVGTYISNMFEERQILLGSEILVLFGILLSFKVTGTYAVPQYVGSALITFVAAEVLEGVNLALLSQVMSSRLARGTYNGGLLSTEAGTLARVVADGTITLAGYLGESWLLNVTLLPSLLICVGSIAATLLTYNSMY